MTYVSLFIIDMKVTGSLSICLHQRVMLAPGPIGFSITVKLFICPGKVYDYFGNGYDSSPPPPQEKSSLKKTTKLHQTLFLGVFLDNEKTDSGWGDNYCICILKRKIV